MPRTSPAREREMSITEDTDQSAYWKSAYERMAARNFIEARDARNKAIDEILALVDPGAKPCDCIEKVNEHWLHNCQCHNSGDTSTAAAWCSDQGNYERIAALKAA